MTSHVFIVVGIVEYESFHVLRAFGTGAKADAFVARLEAHARKQPKLVGDDYDGHDMAIDRWRTRCPGGSVNAGYERYHAFQIPFYR